MYGLPENIDLSFLLKKELEQVCVGQYQVILNFSGDTSIAIQSRMQYRSGEANIVSIKEYPKAASIISSLLGESVNSVYGKSSGTLTLTFSNNVILEIFDDTPQYESYTIKNEGREIIV